MCTDLVHGVVMSKRRTIEIFYRFIDIMKAIDGKSSMREIAEKLRLRPNTVSEYIRDLETMGLVKTKLVSKAPPKIVPQLTEKGVCLIKCLSDS